MSSDLERAQIIESLNLHLADKAETIEKLFCVAILNEGADAVSRILGRFIKYRSIVYDYKEAPSTGEGV